MYSGRCPALAIGPHCVRPFHDIAVVSLALITPLFAKCVKHTKYAKVQSDLILADHSMPKERRVAFSGAEVIEYDALLAPVIKFCGAHGLRNTETLALECEARGLHVSKAHLTLQYIKELQLSLRSRGFEPISDDLKELQTQRRVIELLSTWASLDELHRPLITDILDPKAVRRAQLATKQLTGCVDDGYVFGRRFITVSTFVDMMSSEEILKMARERATKLPELDKKQRSDIKVRQRELVGLFGKARGRPLRSLTLRQTIEEAEARGMVLPEGRLMKGKKNKRAWVDVLRPVMLAELKASKIRQQQEIMLRTKLIQELELEKEQEQKKRIIDLIKTIIKQSAKRDDCTEPEDEATLKEERCLEDVKSQWYLETLLKTVCNCIETADDVTMTE